MRYRIPPYVRILLILLIISIFSSIAQANTPVANTLSRESAVSFLSVARGFIGLAVVVGFAWLLSTNRRAISWRVVGVGLVMQVVLAVCVLYVPPVKVAFEFSGRLFLKVLDFSKQGAGFLLGDMLDQSKYGYIFVFQILPTIIFFSALMSVLFYFGIIQKVVYALAWVFTKALKISGAESLAVAGNIFLGQTEAPLMIKAYLQKMTPSELFVVMTAGMATVAGGVMAAYIGFLGGDDPVQRLLFAKHLLAASVMAAPGAIVISKIIVPQSHEIERKVSISRSQVGSNMLDAIANGTFEGLKLAANVAAMLLVFFAFIALINFVLLKIGDWTTLNHAIARLEGRHYEGLSLEFLFGYAFAPLMWLLGVPWNDMLPAGQLLGEKLIASEFVAYTSLAGMKADGTFLHTKSVIMVTYMLCGFANFASVGIQIGGIGSLAPAKKTELARFGFRALAGGTLASLLSATIIGMFMN